MSAMRVLRSASAARVGRVSRPSSLWRPTNCAWMFGRRPGAPGERPTPAVRAVAAFRCEPTGRRGHRPVHLLVNSGKPARAVAQRRREGDMGFDPPSLFLLCLGRLLPILLAVL